jgi:hypothetical protein
MSAMLAKLRNVGADALMLYLLPACVALLPWRWGFAGLKRIARNEHLYRLAVDPAWAVARTTLADGNEREWKYRFRLLRLVDHVDVYLALLRGRRWRNRHIAESGTWPQPGPCVVLTCHWGAGGFIWPRLHALGFRAHFLMQRPQGRSHGLTRLSHWFTHWRVHRAMRRAGSAGPLYTGGGSGEISTALQAGRSVVGMLDLPARPQQQSLVVSTSLGLLRLPTGLVRLAVAEHVPLVLFRFGVDFDNGKRQLHVEALPPGLSVEQVMQRYAALFDDCLCTEPAAWHLWRELPAMREADAGAESKTQGIQ